MGTITITPESTRIKFDIPAEYIGKKVLITCRVLEEESTTTNKTKDDFLGTLSDQTANETGQV